MGTGRPSDYQPPERISRFCNVAEARRLESAVISRRQTRRCSALADNRMRSDGSSIKTSIDMSLQTAIERAISLSSKLLSSKP